MLTLQPIVALSGRKPTSHIPGYNSKIMGDDDREKELKERLMRRKSEREHKGSASNGSERDEFGRTRIMGGPNKHYDEESRPRDNRRELNYDRDRDLHERENHRRRHYDNNDDRNHNHRRDDRSSRPIDEVADNNESNNINNNSDHHYGPARHIEQILHPGLVIHGEVVRIEPYGAFVHFQDRHQHRHKGLVHISQLASHRVENVTDVLKMNQKVHCVILEVEEDQRVGLRIRLGMKDVDQETGKYTGPDLRGITGSGGDNEGRMPRGRPLNSRRLNERAEVRRDTFLSVGRDWRDGPSTLKKHDGKSSNGVDLSYLRKLWSASPEPPKSMKAKTSGSKQKKSTSDHSESEDGSLSSDSEDDASSSSVSEDTDERRQRSQRKSSRNRKRSRARREVDRRRRKEGSRSKSSRHRRRRSSNSSSNVSSSSASSSSSRSSSSSAASSSSSSNEGREPKRARLNAAEMAQAGDEGKFQAADLKDAQEFKEAIQGEALNADINDDYEEGPMPLQQPTAGTGGHGGGDASYGKALLPGEGQALAQFVQQNLRIPRRGEIGYSGDDIDHYERSGYVMSGSRHARMNAVRIRKENQVYSAEEQRALALLTMEENQQKEAKLMEDFRTMLKEKKKMREDKA